MTNPTYRTRRSAFQLHIDNANEAAAMRDRAERMDREASRTSDIKLRREAEALFARAERLFPTK